MSVNTKTHRVNLSTSKSGLFSLDFELENSDLEDPGDLEYSGQVRMLSNIPVIVPMWVNVTAYQDNKPVSSSNNIVLPVSFNSFAGIIPTGVRANVFYGGLNLKKSGEYLIKARIMATPIGGPSLAESDNLKATVLATTVKGSGIKLNISVPVMMSSGVNGKYKVVLYVRDGQVIGVNKNYLFRDEKIIDFVLGERKTIDFNYTSAVTKTSRKDVEIEVFTGDKRVANDWFDDVFYVD